MIRVLPEDDHDVVREGPRRLIGHRPGMEVVGEAATAGAVGAGAARLHPDVVLDVRLPGGDGVEDRRDMRGERPDAQVLMPTSCADDRALFSSIMPRAAGYILNETRGSALIDAVRTLAGGGSLLEPQVTRRVFERLREGKPTPDPLTRRTDQEQKILELIAQERTNREIAGEVFLSEKTVKHYVSHVLGRLQVSRASEAALCWVRHHPEDGGKRP